MNISHLIQNVREKHSLLRAYENDFVRGLEIQGKGLDLGAKSEDAKYYQFIDMSRVNEIGFVDYFSSGENLVQMDLERPFPITSSNYDFVIAFNVMEHIYNHHQFIAEIHRVLKPSGRVHGFVPFMVRYHPDPNDFYRYTVQGLECILVGAGFSRVEVVPLAAGPFKVAASQIAHVVRNIRLLNFIVLASGILMDKLLGKISGGNSTYALGYYFTACKSDIGNEGLGRDE